MVIEWLKMKLLKMALQGSDIRGNPTPSVHVNYHVVTMIFRIQIHIEW